MKSEVRCQKPEVRSGGRPDAGRWLLAAGVLVLQVAAAQVRPIRDVRQNNDQGEPLLNGQVVTVAGVVTASIQFGPSLGPAYFQDGTGGVALFDSAAARLQIGDSITVTGEVTLYNGLVELQDASVQNHGPAGAPAPRQFTLAEVGRIDTAAGYVESEGWLARLDSIQIDHTSGEVFQGNYNYDVSDPHGGTGLLRIDRDASELVGMRIPDGYITITAIIGQYKTSAPYFGGYQLMPRLAEDLGIRVEVLSIADVVADSNRDFVPDRMGDSVVATGIVTAPSGAFSTEYTDIYVQDGTAGVNVFSYDLQTVAVGDSVVVAGVVDQYNGKTELSSATVTRVAQGRAVPDAELLSFDRPLTERQEGRLVTLVGDVVQAPVRSGSGSNITVKNGTPAIAIRVNDASGINLSWVTVGRKIRFTGIGGQYDSEAPYNSGYQLMPRFQEDLRDTTAAFEPAEQMRIDTVTPNPFAPGTGQFVTIQVNSPRTYRLTIAIYDLEGRLKKELLSNGAGGYYDLKWNGTDRLGRKLPAGIYLLSVKGSSGDGRTQVLSRPIALGEKLN